MRQMIVKQKKRLDGRGVADVRPISCEGEGAAAHARVVALHRGETQALATTTLGTASDEQRIDALVGGALRKFHAAL
jgi:polyribonucleotide nucleotidyltransferase